MCSKVSVLHWRRVHSTRIISLVQCGSTTLPAKYVRRGARLIIQLNLLNSHHLHVLRCLKQIFVRILKMFMYTNGFVCQRHQIMISIAALPRWTLLIFCDEALVFYSSIFPMEDKNGWDDGWGCGGACVGGAREGWTASVHTYAYRYTPVFRLLAWIDDPRHYSFSFPSLLFFELRALNGVLAVYKGIGL